MLQSLICIFKINVYLLVYFINPLNVEIKQHARQEFLAHWYMGEQTTVEG